jgi:hypothetical protein
MSKLWKQGRIGFAAALFLAAIPASSYAACGDLNNDGSVNVIDAIIMSQCIALGGACPAVSPGPLCGTGNLIDCGDVFGDGNVGFAALTTDLATLVDTIAGLDTLFGACKGPGPDIACGGGTVTLPTQNITTNQTWPASCLVKIGGTVQVVDPTPNDGIPVVLTIEPGTLVEGVKGSVDPPALIFNRGTKIDAQGTPSQPIIMTSDQPPGTRLQGDWGGVVFNGRSTVNGPGCEFQGEGLPTPFGGCIETDSSGVASFIRVEFAGIDFTPNNELNAWTMNGIGSQTKFSYLQAHAGNDDCFEWFGGTAHLDHLVASAQGDDGLDFQLGFTGSVQYALVYQNGDLTDPGRDCRGIEGDNSEYNNEATPRSNPQFCNVTFIGADRQPGANDGNDSGILLRRGANAQIANILEAHFNDSGFEIRDQSTTNQACTDATHLTGKIVVRSSVFYDNGGGAEPDCEHAKAGDGLGAPCNTPQMYAQFVANFNVVNPNQPSASCSDVNPNLPDDYPATDSSFCTGPGTPALCCTGAATGFCYELPDPRPTYTGPGTPPSPYACSQLNPLFEDVNYLGGVDPSAACTVTGAGAACDWITRPWIEFNIN